MLILCLFVPSFAHAKEKVNTEKSEKSYVTVESFEVETLSEDMVDVKLSEDVTAKQYVNTGSKKVNSITEITEDSESITTKITALEDFYDLDGNYLKTVLKIEEFANNYDTGKATHKMKEKEYDKPKTLNNPSSSTKINNFNSKSLTNTQQNDIKNSLNILTKEPNFKEVEKEIQGITANEMTNLRRLSSDVQKYEVIKLKDGKLTVDEEALKEMVESDQTGTYSVLASSTVEQAGAFDNYYRHDISNGSFTAQALSDSPHKYVKYTGTTYNNSLNASTMTSFKSNIDSYESYVIQRMEYATWTEVAGWFGVLMGLASIVYGYGTGPAGWVSIVLYYGGALSTFSGLTSSAYATYSRLNLSRYAAQYCQNARDLLYYKNWSNVTMELYSGF